MKTTTSKDGTKIAYNVAGKGPALIFVDGALCAKDMSPSAPIAKQLEGEFTTYLYDRRGRGDSGDTPPYAPEREVEDLAAVIEAAGGSAVVFAQSSGAMLALEAADKLGSSKITKLAVYELPAIIDDSRPPLGAQNLAAVKELIAADRRADAIKLFMKGVEVPAFAIAMLRFMPAWKSMVGLAHTLVYDFQMLSPLQEGKPLPKSLWKGATMPTWVGVGSKSHTWMKNAQTAVANTLPNATLHTLLGQTHLLKADAVVPELRKFFKD